MTLFTLKIILEVAAVLLLLVGYYYEDKVIAFEQNLWKKLRGRKPSAEKKTHSATYTAYRAEQNRAFAEKERIARRAEQSRKAAALQGATNEPRRVA